MRKIHTNIGPKFRIIPRAAVISQTNKGEKKRYVYEKKLKDFNAVLNTH